MQCACILKHKYGEVSLKITVDLGDIKLECFVLMPFAPKFDLIFEEVLRPAIEDVGLVPVRADQIYGNKRIMQDIWNNIKTARLILAELTGRNANVLYELGLAHSLGKQAVIITNTMEDVPFDLKDVRCIVYDKEHPTWGEHLRSNLVRTMSNVLASSDYENLYGGIEFDAKYQPVSADASEREVTKAEEIPVIDGEWTINETWDYGEPLGKVERTATLYLVQEGRELRGYTETSFLFRDPAPLVIQEVSGYIRGRRIEMVATSYQLLRSSEDPTDESWSLDSWRGTLNNAESFSGEVFDEIRKGTFEARKV